MYRQLNERCSIPNGEPFQSRYGLLREELLYICGTQLRQIVERQHDLLMRLDNAAIRIKEENVNEDQQRVRTSLYLTALTKEHHLQAARRSDRAQLDPYLLESPATLPLEPDFVAHGVDVVDSFNSRTKPMRIVFRSVNGKYSVLHKVRRVMKVSILSTARSTAMT